MTRLGALSGGLLLFGLAVAGGLAVAEETPEDPVVAKVGQRDIHLSSVYAKVQQLALADQIDVRDQLARFVESVVQEELLFQYALIQAEGDEAWRDELKALVVAAFLEREVRSQVAVSDEELRAHYEENKSEMGGDHLALRHIPFDDAAACAAAAAAIDSEDDFTAAAEIHHENPVLAQRGGDVGHVMRGRERLGFEEVLFEDDRPGLRRLDRDGICHLLWVGERTVLEPPPFAQIESDLRQYLEAHRERELLEALLAAGEATIPLQRAEVPGQ